MRLRQLTLALLMAIGLSAYAANEKQTVAQVTNAVQLTTDVDYIVTGSSPFATTGSVDIVNTDHAVLIISAIKPSKVLSNWMNYIYINGEPAVDGQNCQVKMYNRGTIVFPYGQNFQPLTCYTEQNYEGESCSNYSEGHSGGYMKTLTANLLNNQIRSFKLKRGYMVTFAIGTGGWGYSRCFIADQEDLEMKTLPSILDKRISSYRIFKWHNAHKAGLASNGDYNANQALNTSWCYDWAQGNANNMPDTEWVPNHIYEDYPSPSTCGSVTASCHMKTNNEPANQSDDHPQSVETILANWQNLMRTGMRLCTPSSWDGSDYWNGTGSVIKVFLDSIDARGWRCDIVDAHCYWTEGNFSNLKNYWWPNYKRPIWISEWIWGASWSGGSGAFANGVTNAQILETTKRILENLNSMECVERYAYWNSESKAHIYENGALTDLGKYYSTMNDGLGYNAAYEFIPKGTRVEAIGALSNTYNRVKGTVALSWTDPNGDVMDNIIVQCKRPGTSTYTNVATVTPKDKTSAEGVNYSYTDTISDPGAYVYRIKATSYNNKTFYTEDVTVNVAPAQGTNEIQYGKLILDNLDESTINYSEPFDDTPCVFIGSLTNKNSKLYAGNVTARNNSKNSFTYQLYPWQSNTGELKNSEELPFLALKAGHHKYSDLDCEVGVADANKASDNMWTDVTEVTFEQPFPEGVTPVVLTEIRNPGYISTAPKTTLNVRIFDVTNTGFKFIIYQEDASTRKVALSKKVCYLAITPGIGCADDPNSIIIAAGHGLDNAIYGSSQRENLFYVQSYDEAGDSIKTEQLRLYSPTVLTALQTNNYPTLTMLRRTDSTEKDEEGTTWTVGTKVKRICDHDITVDGTTINSTSTSENYAAYRDKLGWVAIATYVKGSSAPTAIHTVPANKQGATLSPRIVDGRIYVDGTTSFDLYTASGNKVSSKAVLTPGIYVVKANGKSYKVLVK